MTVMKPAWQQEYGLTGASHPVAGRTGRKYKWWAAALIGLIAAGAGGFYFTHSKSAATVKSDVAPASALSVTVAQVQMGEIPRSLMVTGSLAARDELPIGTETSELALSDVLVDVGDHVKQGQVLARFDDKVLKAQQQQAQAALNEAQANVVEASANAKRADELVKNGWISGKDFDNRRALAQSMEARVGVAKANLALADAKLKQAEILAPTDGTITQRSAHLGAVVSAGELFRMIREDRVELVAELPETDLSVVKAGQPISLHVDGATNPDASATGMVRLIEPTVDVKTRIGRVRIDVAKADGIKPGMFVTGTITLGQTKGLVVPEKAVVYRNGQPNVLVIGQDGTADARAVTLGPRGNGQISLMSGVVAGENVALRGATYLRSGDHVTVVDEPSAAASIPFARSF